MSMEQKILVAGKLALQQQKFVLIRDLNLFVIPDTLVLEILANDLQSPPPPTSGLTIEGRSVLVYEVAYPAKGPNGGLLSWEVPEWVSEEDT